LLLLKYKPVQRMKLAAGNPGCESVYCSKDVLTFLFCCDVTAKLIDLLLHCCHTLLKSCLVAVDN